MLKLIFSIPQWLRVSLSGIYLIIIALLSLLPSDDFPEIPLFPGADKIVHTCMYLGLTWLVCWLMHSEKNHKWYYAIMLFSVGWGIMMEVFQLIMHLGRSLDPFDMVANSVGALIGALIYLAMVRMKQKIESRKSGKLA
ncbi:MAG: VanZ family protein [Mariniphaga sp.]